MSREKVIAIVPARSGSKGVPGKNIRAVGGYPLLAYSIAASGLAKRIERTIISTDSEHIAEIARKYGGETPFLRPAELARDDSPDEEYVLHALDWLGKEEGEVPDYIVQMRPTTPFRDPKIVDKAIDMIVRRPEASGLLSVFEISESPCKMFGMKGDYLEGLCPHDPRPEYFNLPRQAFPPVFNAHGYVDIIKTETILEKKLCYGDRILGFLAPDIGEVDTPEDFDQLVRNFDRLGGPVYRYLRENYDPIDA